MYSACLIGGPYHGGHLESDKPWDTSNQFTYHHSQEYTEWGNVVEVFIWDRMGALPRFLREKFIRAALNGDGTVRALTKENQKIIWPECPDDWWENFT
jgi:hypothetical protein